MASSSNTISYKKHTKIDKNYIKKKVLAHENIIDFGDIRKGTSEIEDIFAAQGWLEMLKDIDNVYHEKPLRTFYLNLKRPSYSRLESVIKGKAIVIDTNIIAELLQIPNEGKMVFFDKVLTATLLKSYPEDTIKTLLLEEGFEYTNKLSTTHLKALPDMLLTIVRANIVQQMGHGAEVNNTQIAVLCSLINREKNNLPQLMIDQMWKSLNQSNHGLAYPHLLTKMFKKLKLTTQNDELNNHSPLNFINAKTMTHKRRFVEIDDGFQVSRAVLGSQTSQNSDATTVRVGSENPSYSAAGTSSQDARFDKMEKKLNKIMSLISKIPGMPPMSSDSDEE